MILKNLNRNIEDHTHAGNVIRPCFKHLSTETKHQGKKKQKTFRFVFESLNNTLSLLILMLIRQYCHSHFSPTMRKSNGKKFGK